MVGWGGTIGRGGGVKDIMIIIIRMDVFLSSLLFLFLLYGKLLGLSYRIVSCRIGNRASYIYFSVGEESNLLIFYPLYFIVSYHSTQIPTSVRPPRGSFLATE